jgi:hypothetical protein
MMLCNQGVQLQLLISLLEAKLQTGLQEDDSY